MNWTDERVELLRKLWSEGLSASQIAAQLGGGQPQRRDRQGAPAETVGPRPLDGGAGAPEEDGAGIIDPEVGVARRNRARATSPPRSARPRCRRSSTPSRWPAITSARSRTSSCRSRGSCSWSQLTERTCKWPNGDPLSEDFNFCGNDAAETGPYCSYHAKIAFQPASERRRSR